MDPLPQLNLQPMQESISAEINRRELLEFVRQLRAWLTSLEARVTALEP